MRADWNARAKEDAYFYAGFLQRRQAETDFLASSRDVLPAIAEGFHRLTGTRRALEIGCGPGRLMRAMSGHFDEIIGVDVSDEMIALARENLRGANAQVHLTSGADLAIFPGDHFDFVYSYVVFQHIPSREIVLNYLRETQRVLKPGGILRCQMRGSAPDPAELRPDAETWTGCFFTAGEIFEFARARRFPLVALSGIDTQHMWTTFRKGRDHASTAGMVLRGVTEQQVPARGAGAAVSLWADGMPDDISLADCAVCFDNREQTGCYVSPVSETGACQLNAVVPRGLSPGAYQVTLKVRGALAEGAHTITIVDSPAEPPQIVSLTDGVNLASAWRLETPAVRVTIRNVPNPDELSFSVSGRPVSGVWHECDDSVTETHIFYFRLEPSQLHPGRRVLGVSMAGKEVAAAGFEIQL